MYTVQRVVDFHLRDPRRDLGERFELARQPEYRAHPREVARGFTHYGSA
jgi:hypothetical protein